MNISDLIQPRHLHRQAAIYIRQSTPQQVTSNQESLELQYAMQDRARSLGWRESDITVVDDDLGVTASDVSGREGFQRLAAQIGIGEIGIVVAYDATRLARNCTHWYQLLDLCGRADCLIADRDGVYDASNVNGRLLLGLKGQISELELHTIRARLTAGVLNKAQRGELALLLPVGLERLETGEVVKHPDASVQRTVSLVFEMVVRKRGLGPAMRYLKQESIRLPARDRFGDIQWRVPTAAALARIVKNPAYAGAFVYGRTQTTQADMKKQVTRLPPEHWKVCIRDKYPAYVSWETFEEIQAMLKSNRFLPKSPGAPRQGQALLQGILYCGKCGRQIAARERRQAFYCCRSLAITHGEPMCQYLDAAPVDRYVIDQFLQAISVAEIDLSTAVLDEAGRQDDQFLSARRDEVARCQYQEQRARRQFNNADPENRLVAAELERRWEHALQELQSAQRLLIERQNNMPRWGIPVEMSQALKDVGPQLTEIWQQGLLNPLQQKTLLRTLVDKVVLQRIDDEDVHVRIVWRGGETTSDAVAARRNYHTFDEMPYAADVKKIISEMAVAGHTDEEIAASLTAQGYRGAKTPDFNRSQVQRLRLAAGINRRPNRPSHQDGFLTVHELSTELDLSAAWIYQQIAKKTLSTTKAEPGLQIHRFPDTPETREFVLKLAKSLHAPSRFTRCKPKRAA